MILKREGNLTTLDGAGTIILNKKEVALKLEGFGDGERVFIKNQYLLGNKSGRLVQIKDASKFLYSEEIEQGKVIAKKVGLVTYACSLAVVVGVNISMATKLIKNK